MTTINYSEFNTLAQCERKWVYSYARREEETGSRRGLHLGTLLHLGTELWLRGEYAENVWLPETWSDDIDFGGKPGTERSLSLADFDSSIQQSAISLLNRYVEHYGPVPPSDWEVISTEEWCVMDLPKQGLTVVGRTDGLIRVDGKLWLREVKSYKNRGRLNYIRVDPQLTLYAMLCEATCGEEIHGVLYDGVYTYEWVKPRAAADSFDRRWVDISNTMIVNATHYLAAAVERRDHLLRRALASDSVRYSIPNIGAMCNACGHKARCWAELGDDQYEVGDIEVEDE
jgi:hypothetical protein